MNLRQPVRTLSDDSSHELSETCVPRSRAKAYGLRKHFVLSTGIHTVMSFDPICVAGPVTKCSS